MRFFPSASSCVIAFALLGTQSIAENAFAKEKDTPSKIVDSGSFGVFNGAHRVATETFSIKQDAEGSVIVSEFKSEQGEQKAVGLGHKKRDCGQADRDH